MIAVIPAAGRGIRLGGLTERTPKSLVPVAGRPVIDRVIDGLVGAGIETFVVVHGYLGDQVVSALQAEYAELDIRFVHQPEQNGTAGAFLACEPVVGGGPFVYAWADLVVPNQAYMAIATDNDGAASHLGVDRSRDPGQGAAVVVDDGRVVDIVEKPPAGTFSTPFNATGLGLLTAEAWQHLHQVRPSARGELELTSALQSMIRHGCLIRAVEVGPAFDIGTPDGLAAAGQWLGSG